MRETGILFPTSPIDNRLAVDAHLLSFSLIGQQGRPTGARLEEESDQWPRGAIGLTIAGANAHDQRLFHATLDSMPVCRPRPTSQRRQHLCCDNGFDADTIRREARRRRHTPHIKTRGEEQIAKRHGSNRNIAFIVAPRCNNVPTAPPQPNAHTAFLTDARQCQKMYDDLPAPPNALEPAPQTTAV